MKVNDVPICPVCEEEVVATMCTRGPLSAESDQAIRDVVIAAHRMLAGHPRPARVQLRRRKGWRLPEGVINCARPGRWGNPYSLGLYRDGFPDSTEAERRARAVSDFRGLVEGRWADLYPSPPPYPPVDEIVAELRGRDLACWCPLDQTCHCDVLLERANMEDSDAGD